MLSASVGKNGWCLLRDIVIFNRVFGLELRLLLMIYVNDNAVSVKVLFWYFIGILISGILCAVACCHI